MAHANAKKREKKEGPVRIAKKRKGIEAQSMKPSTQARATDALRGEKEQDGKPKKKETGNGPTTRLLRTIWSPPTIRRDHRANLFF